MSESILANLSAAPLVVFELANNHMGDVDHGLATIRAFADVAREFDRFRFAFKFQYRHIPTFIHPDWMDRLDVKYVRRFRETDLSRADRLRLRAETREQGMAAICTAFDEASVDLVEAHDYEAIKIASCSFDDWPLLERVAVTELPIIASTAAAPMASINAVVSFLRHRRKEFALMHCVAQYPTPPAQAEMNQIDLLRESFAEAPVGFSTHEAPDETGLVKLAVAKGCPLFEKHVALPTPEHPPNAYSATPDQMRAWLTSLEDAFAMCGRAGSRTRPTEKEVADINQFRRGAFVKKAMRAGRPLHREDLFYAFPMVPGQVTANDLSKYRNFVLKEDLGPQAALMWDAVDSHDRRECVWQIVKEVRRFVQEHKVVIPPDSHCEVSHHYGIERFREFGAALFTVVNRGYCKKVIVLLPGQQHPEHMHKRKDESFLIVAGSMTVDLDGSPRTYRVGEVITLEPGIRHAFASDEGCVFEEISTTHLQNDSFYTDASIGENPARKTTVMHWIE